MSYIKYSLLTTVSNNVETSRQLAGHTGIQLSAYCVIKKTILTGSRTQKSIYNTRRIISYIISFICDVAVKVSKILGIRYKGNTGNW